MIKPYPTHLHVRVMTLYLLFTLTLSSCQIAQNTDAKPQEFPNIVIVLADDQTWSDSGVYGNPDVYTPNIDRLASEGMRFTRAFTGTAMCAPSRQQLYTGLYPIRNGAYPNGSWVNEGTRSIVHYLQDLGYRTGITGKTHVGPPDSFPWEILGDWERAKRIEIDFSAVEEFINRDKGQPFFLIVASHNPHYKWPAVEESRYNPDVLTVPPHLVDTPETRRALATYYEEVSLFDDELGEAMTLIEQAGAADNTLFVYSSEQGNMFPFAKWTLYESGIHTAMIVRWPGNIEAGAVSEAMVHYVDVVPTLLDVVGSSVADLDGESFYNVLENEADTHREYIFGAHTTRGISNWADDYPIRSIRSERYKLIWNLNADGVFGNNLTAENRGGYYFSWNELGDEEAVRKYRIYQKRPSLELYNIEADPFEQHNLVDNPALDSVKLDLLTRLESWMETQGDRGVASEQEAQQRMSGGNVLKRRSTPVVDW